MRKALTVNTTLCDAGLTDLGRQLHLLIGGDPIPPASTNLGEDLLPVLLYLPRKPGQKRFAGHFGLKTLVLQSLRVLDSRGILMRPGGVNSSTVGTPPTFDPKPSHETKEIPNNESVTPEARTCAGGTTPGFLPRKALAKDLNIFQIQPKNE
jgi:hypothetical protein